MKLFSNSGRENFESSVGNEKNVKLNSYFRREIAESSVTSFEARFVQI